MSDFLFAKESLVTNILEKALDAASLRHRLLADNLANVDTPNFKRRDISFQEILKKAMQNSLQLTLVTTHKRHLNNLEDNLKFKIIQEGNTVFRNDGNNVDIDAETVEMIKNSLFYNTCAQLLGSKFASLRYVIEEGRR